VHSGASYTALRIDFDLASGVVRSPHSFEINYEAAKRVILAQFGVEDASQMTEAWSKDNPLNQGSRNVINIFESNEKMENLKAGYTFFLVFFVSHQARQNVNRARASIQRQKLDVVNEFSRIFFEQIPAQESGDKDKDDMDGLPRPEFSDIKHADSYCLWAVRNEEVARLRAPVPVLSDEEFAQKAMEIEAAETAEKGPLPEDPNPPLLALPAPEQPAASPVEEQPRRSSTPERPRKKAPAKKANAKKPKKPTITEPVDDDEDPMDIPE
jgi:hypothetical protein